MLAAQLELLAKGNAPYSSQPVTGSARGDCRERLRRRQGQENQHDLEQNLQPGNTWQMAQNWQIVRISEVGAGEPHVSVTFPQANLCLL